MKQLLLPKAFNGERKWTLKGPDLHYLKNVLRLNKDSKLLGIDHSGQKWDISIEEINKKDCSLNLNKIETKNLDIELNLFQCIPKGKKFDRICREATECGIKNIIPVISLYSIPKEQQEKLSKKSERYNGIIKEAIQQSGSSIITKVNEVIKLEDINIEKEAINLFFHQETIDKKRLHHYLNMNNYNSINILIGPEGGLSDKETSLLISKGFKPVYLGNNVLRTETAAIYAIAAVKTVIMEILDA